MVARKIFKRVLAEYMRIIFTEVYGCGNECCLELPYQALWVNVDELTTYFDPSRMADIQQRYLTHIDPQLKETILKQFPKLKPYFKVSLWNEMDLNAPPSPRSTAIMPGFASTLQYPTAGPSGYVSPDRASSPDLLPIHLVRFSPPKAKRPPPRSPSPVRSRSPSPVRSRGSSPRRSPSPPSSPIDLPPPMERPSGYNTPASSPLPSPPGSPRFSFSQRIKAPKKKKKPTKRQYRKRLKLYPFLNQFPDDGVDYRRRLKPHESNLILKALDGSSLDHLNLPLSLCQKVRKQCRTYNPATKRYRTDYADDGSETTPLNLTLQY